MCSVNSEPLKSKLLYWRHVSDAICSIELLKELGDGDVFDQHVQINEANEHINELEDEISHLSNIDITDDSSFHGSWPFSYPSADEMNLEDEMGFEEDWEWDDYRCEVESYRAQLIEEKEYELQDTIEEHEMDRDHAIRMLALVPADAIEAVRFLLCGGEFKQTFNA